MQVRFLPMAHVFLLWYYIFMLPEEKELLRKSIVLAQENNDILRKMQRSMRFSHIASILYWLFIIGSIVGAFYVIQPYIQAFNSAYGGAQNSFNITLNGLIENLKRLGNINGDKSPQ